MPIGPPFATYPPQSRLVIIFARLLDATGRSKDAKNVTRPASTRQRKRA
jgi:hypothetical protein